MGKKDKFKARGAAAYTRPLKGVETREKERPKKICISLRAFDRNQGQSFAEWEDEKLLAKAVTKLSAVCELTVQEATSQSIIKPYHQVSFPPDSAFTHPVHVPQGVTWCSMHVQGKECVIGYFEEHIFHIVFLDKEHEFWKTEKKHT